MGAVLSSESDIRENELLKKFCAINSVNKNDPFWNKLSSYNFMIDSKNRYTYILSLCNLKCL
jgi:hypothetical protein